MIRSCRLIKKIMLLLCFFVALIPLFSVKGEEQDDILSLTRRYGYSVKPADKPVSSIVVNAKNGDIIWQDNIDASRDPASMSKLFTLYLLFEDIKAGKLSLSDHIRASQTDQDISQIYAISNNKIVAGVDYPIRDLITMTAVPSSNAATLMLANYMSDNDAGAFINRINTTAQKLGMKNTFFTNASGAVASAFEGHYSPEGYDSNQPNKTSARDLAILCYHFLKNYPEILEFTCKSSVKTMDRTPYEEEFHSYNYSLPGDKFGIKGVDGLKTGSSPSAAFNAVITAKRDDPRLISIVMGVGDWSDQEGEFHRHPFINAITEYGFTDDALHQTNHPNIILADTHKTNENHSRHYKNKNEPKTFYDKFEKFVDRHHHFVFLCLSLFIISVLITSLIAIYK